MEGVHIGDGAVIGAEAVATKDVAPYEIMGVLARHIKWRTEPKTIEFLLNYKWWDKNKGELEGMKDIMQSDIDLCKVDFERMKAKI